MTVEGIKGLIVFGDDSYSLVASFLADFRSILLRMRRLIILIKDGNEQGTEKKQRHGERRKKSAPCARIKRGERYGKKYSF